MHGRRYTHSSPCASGGLDFFCMALLAFTLLPLLLPTLAIIVSLAFFVVRTLVVAMLIGKLTSCLCDAAARDGVTSRCGATNAARSGCAKNSSSGCPCPMRACFAKMKAACAKECATATATATVRDDLNRDLSSARTSDDAETMTVTIAVPGISAADLSVDVLDRTLR